MDELRGNEAVWVFDSERIKIRYEAKGWFKNPLHKQLGVLEIPVGAIRSVDFRPKAGAKKGWILQLRLRERMDPYGAVGAMIDEKFQPFRLTGPAKNELIAEYLADQARFAAEQWTEDPPADLVTRLVPDLPLHIQTSEGTANVDEERLRLVWSGFHASGHKKKQQRREYELAEITGVEWVPSDGWGWGYLRVMTEKSAKESSAKPRQDLNVLLAGADAGEPEKTLIMAATVIAHVWARDGADRSGPGTADTTEVDIDVHDRPDLTDPGWWRDAAQSAVKSLVGPRAGLDLSGLRGRGDEDTAALGKGAGEVGQKKELTASTAPRKLGHDTEWVYVQIERLGELKEKGLLTEEEFTAKKAELLDRI